MIIAHEFCVHLLFLLLYISTYFLENLPDDALYWHFAKMLLFSLLHCDSFFNFLVDKVATTVLEVKLYKY